MGVTKTYEEKMVCRCCGKTINTMSSNGGSNYKVWSCPECGSSAGCDPKPKSMFGKIFGDI